MQPSASLLPRLPMAALVAACVAFPVSGFHWYSAPKDTGETVAAYSARFEGIAMDGQDLVWTGAAGGVVNGDMTVRVEQLGSAANASRTSWPVHAVTFVVADDPARSFAAELDGNIDWSARTIMLSGEITDGYMTGARIEQRGMVKDDYNSVGSIRISPTLLARR